MTESPFREVLPFSLYSNESKSGGGSSTWNNSDYQDETQDAYNRDEYLVMLGRNIRTYGLPLIIIGGTVGNVLSIATLCSKYFRHAPCTVLLLALAVVDTLVLTFRGSDAWLGATYGLYWGSFLQRPRIVTLLYCTQHIIVTLSPWTVVLITFERFISVMWPFRAGTLCSRKRMAISWCITALVIVLAWSCFNFLCFGQHYNNYCSRVDTHVLHTFYFWICFTVIAAVPLLLIVCGNVCIIYKTIAAHWKRTQTMISSQSSSAAASNARALTTMLVAVCIVFVLTTFPLPILDQIWIYMTDNPAFDHGLHSLLSSCALTLYFINSATNFILYFFCGTQFRKAFLKLMCRCKHCGSPCHSV